ncbi:DUF1996 domain-containing protein [Microbispora sp. SCL1-1]|uniref:DUF1996 domain-containing protein n=1 Tax=unclassified Microbispora TaxID=2614687 RepID=UPI0011583AD7|nr:MULTISPECIES: DUF1996 domain-containing protein [unclassified Microbispora]NJP25746.1 DUF1996 domain-containing protein [Microbispora sp. CL1-1]TQS13237.1 DUF1996 domain-containing protein [Microbispora sp. SCL1-1]
MRKRLVLAMAGVLIAGSLTGVGRPAFADHCDPSVQGAECEDVGPALEDFVDIRQVPPGDTGVRAGRGSFTSRCGRNENGHRNSDNHIVTPGVSNGAHHVHDYVGNLTTNGFSTDQSLAAGGTTCRFGDKSAYFWPVLRSRTGVGAAQAAPSASPSPDASARSQEGRFQEGRFRTGRGRGPGSGTGSGAGSGAGGSGTGANPGADEPGGASEGNVGRILLARSVTLQFRGNPVSRVVAMPRFLKLITGDAKAATNGGANARAQWTCTGFTNRLTSKYPLCPRGSLVLRVLDFPSCWDGRNTDSADHRTHVVFPGANGACPAGTRAIPQLRMTLAYSVPSGPSFAVDSFPEQRHNPITDHADFENVMPDRLMNTVVTCVNRGLRC